MSDTAVFVSDVDVGWCRVCDRCSVVGCCYGCGKVVNMMVTGVDVEC